jgi:hypothetical protein
VGSIEVDPDSLSIPGLSQLSPDDLADVQRCIAALTQAKIDAARVRCVVNKPR